MDEYVLKTRSLTKTYRNTVALDNVTITLKPGRIYGLIGHNGAGKTTFMRLIAGLTFPTSGEINLFGYTQAKHLQHARQRIGFMIEAPAINTSMSAKENVHLHRIIKGIPNEELEQELLALVGLQNTGKKKARNFSLGMKQRLGIALSLIGSPELLILDEPINGLDPVGIVDMRNLLQTLCAEKNITILLSSHNLSQLYQVATDYIIIDHGKIIETITLSELEEQCKQYVLLRTNQPELLVSTLEKELHTQNYLVMPDKSIRLFDFTDRMETLAALFQRENILITNLSIEGNTLENYYINLVERSRNV
ncbi:ABC transporter ATP-binding protein [Dielma fastidiosa]|uniref:ABC transporter ATP-binding protein n=1 Tax=Dielma fastidiosa TaxID=1034346 RepID=UPI000E53F204|nr:ABC transporter ATP-binding protein [Dielma fastidiosa]RHM99037.1 ABC transporter ATP-binding protein [Dielma fastidiosa]